MTNEQERVEFQLAQLQEVLDNLLSCFSDEAGQLVFNGAGEPVAVADDVAFVYDEAEQALANSYAELGVGDEA